MADDGRQVAVSDGRVRGLVVYNKKEEETLGTMSCVSSFFVCACVCVELFVSVSVSEMCCVCVNRLCLCKSFVSVSEILLCLCLCARVVCSCCFYLLMQRYKKFANGFLQKRISFPQDFAKTLNSLDKYPFLDVFEIKKI